MFNCVALVCSKFKENSKNKGSVKFLQLFSLSTLATLVKMGANFVSIKVLSVVIGPTGLVLLGQISNFVSLLITIFGGIGNGVTKYVAEYNSKDDNNNVSKIISTGIWISVFLSFFISALLYCFAKQLSLYLLFDVKFSSIFIVLSITFIFTVLNNIFIAILNGFKDIAKIVKLNIVSSLIGLTSTVVFLICYGTYGALLSVVVYNSIVFIVCFANVCRNNWFKNLFKTLQIDFFFVRKIFGFVVMSSFSAFILPVVQLILRKYISINTGVHNAGIWEGMNRISSMFILVFISFVNVYYLPKYSESSNEKSRILLFRYWFYFLPVSLFAWIVIYTFRDWLILFIFTKDFNNMRELFFFQILGDVIRIMSAGLSIIMIAKSMIGLYLVSELLLGLIYLILTVLFVNYFSVEGAAFSYFITYLIYFSFMVFRFRLLILRKM